MNYFKKFLYVFEGRQRQLAFLMFIFMATSVLEVFGIGMIGPFLDLAGNPEKIQNSRILGGIYSRLQFQSDNQFIIALGAFIIFVFLVKSVLYLSSKAYTFEVLFNQRSAVRVRLLNAYMLAPYEFHLSRNSSEFIDKIVTEANRFTNLVSLPLVEFCSHAVVVITIILLMAATNMLLVLIAFATLLPAFLGFIVLSKRMKEWGKGASIARQRTVKAVNQGLGGLKETSVIGCEDFFRGEMHEHVRIEASLEALFRTSNFIPRTLIEALLMIAIIGFICFSQFFFQQDFQSIISTMGVFAVAALRLVPAGSQMLQSLGSLRNSAYTLDALYLDLKETEQPVLTSRDNAAVTGEPLTFENSLELKDVVYRYPGAKTVSLNGISMSIKRGESIGLIGPSGAGKTTLVDVVLGLLRPESGDICIDGQSIYANMASWRKLVGYIPQSIYLLDETIERNVAFGVPDGEIDHTRVWQAIKAAQLEQLVKELPEGVQTSIGERGVRLSGGQRQRIGIARALYHEREILVLDEATSALDNETERLISESVEALAGAKTLVIIAHRLTTIRHCDRIYALEEGRVAKQGSYESVVLSHQSQTA